MKKKIPSVAPTRWNFTSRLTINTVQQYRFQLIDYFESIIESSQWDNETLIKAQGFVAFLNRLEISSVIFGNTDILYDIFQTKKYDILYCSQKVKDTPKFI